MQQKEGGEAALIWWRGVPEDLETLDGVAQKGGGGRGREEEEKEGEEEQEEEEEWHSSEGGRGCIPGCILWR